MSSQQDSKAGFDPAALTLSAFFRIGTIAFLIVVFQVLTTEVFDVDLLLMLLMAMAAALVIYSLSIVKVK